MDGPSDAPARAHLTDPPSPPPPPSAALTPAPNQPPPSPPPSPLAPPASRRALAFAAATLAAVYAAARAAQLADEGLPLSAAVLAGVGALYAAFLAAVALAPAATGGWFARRTAARLGRDGHLASVVLLASAFFLVFGLGSVLPFAMAVERSRAGLALAEAPLSEGDVVLGLALNLLVLVVPVVVWLRVVRGLRGAAMARALGLRGEGASGAIAFGVAIAVASLLVLAALALGFAAVGLPPPPNERALDIGQALSIPGALLVATLAALSEETFFRGFLQPRIGLAAQAVLFSIAHLSYFHALQLVATLLLGLAFGLAYRWTRSLLAPIAAHFAFNALMLVAASQLPTP